jgi:hypothetical protein
MFFQGFPLPSGSEMLRDNNGLLGHSFWPSGQMEMGNAEDSSAQEGNS